MKICIHEVAGHDGTDFVCRLVGDLLHLWTVFVTEVSFELFACEKGLSLKSRDLNVSAAAVIIKPAQIPHNAS